MRDEVKLAYEELDAAIQKVRFAMDPDDVGVLGDWVVIGAEHKLTPDGIAGQTTYMSLFRGGGIPYHCALGLLQTGLEVLEETADGND
jgi:hypothetical protein